MLKNKNIVCFANDWFNDPTSKHQIMKLLANNNKILWINSISMRTPRVSKKDISRILNKLASFFKGIKEVQSNLFVFTPIVLPFPNSKLIRKFNNFILWINIKYYCNKLNMKDIQLWTFVPTMVNFIGKLNEKLLVYYCVDEWSKFSFIDEKKMKDMEISLLKKSDIVFTSASFLYKEKSKYNINTHLVTHGVDYDHFSRSLNCNFDIPNDLKDINKPIVGFFGLIHEWIDLELIKSLAQQNVEIAFVLIGKADIDINKYKSIQNIYFLGQKPYSELPIYCKFFDIGLIPFKINELTINVNPIKLREYLAAGLPVISTPLPEVFRYKDNIHISYEVTSISKYIHTIINENNINFKKKLSQLMSTETWENKVSYISALINKMDHS